MGRRCALVRGEEVRRNVGSSGAPCDDGRRRLLDDVCVACVRVGRAVALFRERMRSMRGAARARDGPGTAGEDRPDDDARRTLIAIVYRCFASRVRRVET